MDLWGRTCCKLSHFLFTESWTDTIESCWAGLVVPKHLSFLEICFFSVQNCGKTHRVHLSLTWNVWEVKQFVHFSLVSICVFKCCRAGHSKQEWIFLISKEKPILVLQADQAERFGYKLRITRVLLFMY